MAGGAQSVQLPDRAPFREVGHRRLEPPPVLPKLHPGLNRHPVRQGLLFRLRRPGRTDDRQRLLDTCGVRVCRPRVFPVPFPVLFQVPSRLG